MSRFRLLTSAPRGHEIDDTQNLSCRAIARASADIGFSGYVAHRSRPTRDPLTSLREAAAIIDV